MRRFLLLILLLSCLFNLKATTFLVDGVMYEIRSTTAPLTVAVTPKSGYGNYVGDVVIPSIVSDGTNTYRVTCIGDGAFYNCSGLKSVQMPSSIKTIERQAFCSVRDRCEHCKFGANAPRGIYVDRFLVA